MEPPKSDYRRTPKGEYGSTDPGYHSSDDDDEGNEYFDDFKKDSIRRESLAADKLSMRLLQVDDDDSETEERVLRESLDLSYHTSTGAGTRWNRPSSMGSQVAFRRFCTMVSLILLALVLVVAAFWVGVEFIGPPNQPVGPYELVERQVNITQIRAKKTIT